MELSRLWDDARVGSEDAVDIGVDLARVRSERRGERHGSRVGAAPAERRDVEGGRDSLEAGDEDDPVLVQRLVDPPGAHLDDLGLAVNGVGDDSRLGAR